MPKFDVDYAYREGSGLDYCMSTNGGSVRIEDAQDHPTACRAAIDYAYETHKGICHVLIRVVREIME